MDQERGFHIRTNRENEEDHDHGRNITIGENSRLMLQREERGEANVWEGEGKKLGTETPAQGV